MFGLDDSVKIGTSPVIPDSWKWILEIIEEAHLPHLGLPVTWPATQQTHTFLRGRTVRNAADKLDLSPRTVEFYLKNMKRKLNCHTKSELIELISDSDFLKNIDFKFE